MKGRGGEGEEYQKGWGSVAPPPFLRINPSPCREGLDARLTGAGGGGRGGGSEGYSALRGISRGWSLLAAALPPPPPPARACGTAAPKAGAGVLPRGLTAPSGQEPRPGR